MKTTEDSKSNLEEDDFYAYPCPSCPGRVTLGKALRGGKLFCTDCEGVVELIALENLQRRSS